MTTAKQVISGVVALALVAIVGYLALVQSNKPVNDPVVGLASVNWFQRGIGWFGEGLYIGSDQQFGVTSTGVLTSATTTNTTSYWSVGGIDYASVQVSMAATSSVPCAIPNPWFGNATSTVLNQFVQVTANGLATAQTLDVSTSTSAYGSSTPAFVKKYATGTGQFSFAWTPGLATSSENGVLGLNSTLLNGTSPYMIAPSEYITTRIATGTAGTFASYYTGTCQATFAKP